MPTDRILLIGGEANAIQGLVELLCLEGFRVDAFREAGEARESFSSCGMPDAVIADIDLPGVFGMDPFEPVRLIPPAVPFILLTSRADATCSRRAWAAGVSAILEKPIKFTDLMALLRRFGAGLDRDESLRETYRWGFVQDMASPLRDRLRAGGGEDRE